MVGREGSAELGNWEWKEIEKERGERGERGEGKEGRGERSEEWIRNHNTEGTHELVK